mmetsp:Transcript_12748/g.12551  ORF Transcript_12748/g.12551 Transcript_12748/m.12551 type:complete len:97 (-) Transcript_12748:20-310(-)
MVALSPSLSSIQATAAASAATIARTNTSTTTTISPPQLVPTTKKLPSYFCWTTDGGTKESYDKIIGKPFYTKTVQINWGVEDHHQKLWESYGQRVI